MRRWFHCAPDWDTPEAEVDLRVGGKVRVVMWRPDGTKVGKSSVAKALQEVISEPGVSLPTDRVSAG